MVLAVLICACNLRRTEVTLTLAPIETRTLRATDIVELPTETKVIQSLPTSTTAASPTYTVNPSPSNIPKPTATRMPDATLTATPTQTQTNTNVPTASQTAQPTATETALPPATDTSEPIATNTVAPTATNTVVPTRTALPTPTMILPRTATPTATASPVQDAPATASPSPLPDSVAASATDEDKTDSLPTLTPLPTLDPTELAILLATPVPLPTSPATWTAVPTLLPTAEVAVVPAPATPVVSTATQSQDRGPITAPAPAASTARPQLGPASFTPSPTRFQPTVAVRQELLADRIPPPVFQPTTFNTLGAAVYQYDVGRERVFGFEGLQLGGGVVLFAPNPAEFGSFLRTDQVGMLHYRAIGSPSETTLIYSPFFRGFSAASSDSNKNRVVEIDWSANGQQFSFRIDPPPGQDNSNAGVWFWQPANATPTDPTYQLIRDCVTAGYIPCRFVNPSNAQYWKTSNVAWSPVTGSNDILLTVDLTAEGRGALAIVQALRDAARANNAPHFIRYDFGHWNPNGNGIIVSGRRPDGRVIIGEVSNALNGEQLIFDASAAGLWMQDAVRRPDGQIVALGRPGGSHVGGPVALYDRFGRAFSAPIGISAPSAVHWYPDRSAVVVTVGNRQYTANANNGAVFDTTDLTRNPSFGNVTFGVAPIPQAVISGSEFWPGQQLRTVQNLNVRQGPSTSTQIVGGLDAGDYVAVLAGPYDSEGYRWWRVQTANNVLGWIAGTIGGRATIRPG